jgi:hypothetical protein
LPFGAFPATFPYENNKWSVKTKNYKNMR